jgi:hypothetical protein
MNFDIFPFVLGKLFVSVLLLLLYLWPIAVFVVVVFLVLDENNDLKRLTKRILLTVISAFSVLFYGAYLNSLWPNTPSGNKCGCTPSDGLEYVLQSWNEYKQVKVQEAPARRTDGPVEVQRYMLVDWNPPKHFYVTLKNMKTGFVAENVYVSKHCNAASSLQRNVEYNLQVQSYTLSNRPGMVFYEFKDLYSAFC